MTSSEHQKPASDEEHLSPSAEGETEPTPITKGADEPADTGAREEPGDTGETTPADRIQELEDELTRAKEHMLRALADAENARKRAQKDREDAGKYAITAFARDLLDFADNFTRALDSMPEDLKEIDPRIENVISGIESMDKELLRTFEKHGIKKLDPIGEKFDPNFHEVMFETPGTGQPAGTVIQIIEPGYTINDRLLRPARVGVAKAMPGDQDTSGNDKPGSQIDQEA